MKLDPIIYDLEVLKNCFLYLAKSPDREYSFEVSSRKNELPALLDHLNVLMSHKSAVMVGFNNLGYDYFFIQLLIQLQNNFTYKQAYELNRKIIHGKERLWPIKASDRAIRQLDLMRLHGFDSPLRRTSLKQLQVAMRSERVENIPFVDKDLSSKEMDETIEYGWHDVKETFKFWEKSQDEVNFRIQLMREREIQGDLLNMSDVKIGTNYVTQKIGMDKCYRNGTVINTPRNVVDIGKLILPSIKFSGEKYQKVLDWFKSLKVKVGSKEDRPAYNYKDTFNALEIHFGLGGIHGARPGTYEGHGSNVPPMIRCFRDTIIDVDVTGMYPSVAIANGFHPLHLGDKFSQVYSEIPKRRAETRKGTPINMMLKLAGNSVYGNSKNPYSPIYDPAFTYSVTVNGQLQMLMLAEMINNANIANIIQINTDGLTLKINRFYEPQCVFLLKEWEKITGLKLEQTLYEKMIVKNVNAYCAYDLDGKAKLKKEYWYPTGPKDYQGTWHKNFSKLVVPKAVQAVYQGGLTPEEAVKTHFDRFDFMLMVKSKGKNIIHIGGEKKTGIIRYYISKTGLPMEKIDTPKDDEIGKYKRKPKVPKVYYNTIMNQIPEDTWDERIHTKNKSRYEVKSSERHKNPKGGVYLVKECNDASNFNWNDVDYDYYIEEVRKLLI